MKLHVENQNRFNWMVTIYLLIITIVLWLPHTAKAEYSSGYRMGQLTKFSVKGHFVKSGEGQLSMGREGSFYERCRGTGKDRKCRRINPWSFSAEPSNAGSINQYSGQYVVIKYSEVQMNNPLKYSTAYRVVNVAPVDKSIDLGKGFVAPVPGGSKSKGFRIGRIVKASRKGHLSKTYELIVQVGNAGNQYKHMSTKNKQVFDFAIKALKSAKKVKVLYTERGLLQFSMDDTRYQLYGIETLQDI